jgi:hypothetical protein
MDDRKLSRPDVAASIEYRPTTPRPRPAPGPDAVTTIQCESAIATLALEHGKRIEGDDVTRLARSWAMTLNAAPGVTPAELVEAVKAHLADASPYFPVAGKLRELALTIRRDRLRVEHSTAPPEPDPEPLPRGFLRRQLALQGMDRRRAEAHEYTGPERRVFEG